jgi:hypothetical protein
MSTFRLQVLFKNGSEKTYDLSEESADIALNGQFKDGIHPYHFPHAEGQAVIMKNMVMAINVQEIAE